MRFIIDGFQGNRRLSAVVTKRNKPLDLLYRVAHHAPTNVLRLLLRLEGKTGKHKECWDLQNKTHLSLHLSQPAHPIKQRPPPRGSTFASDRGNVTKVKRGHIAKISSLNRGTSNGESVSPTLF